MKISQTVFELQSGHDFVTDRRTDDPGKNNMSPNPKEGRHKYKFKNVTEAFLFDVSIYVTITIRVLS